MAVTPDSGHEREGGSEETRDERGSEDRQIAALEREVERLEAELAERDRELQRVVERYEALLDEQTRARRAADGSGDGRFVWSGRQSSPSGESLLSTMRQVLVGGW